MSSDVWEDTAKNLKFAGEKEMWESLYSRYSISQLAAKFGVASNVIRARINATGVPMRKRGGPNNVKVLVDDKLVEDVIKQGIPKVAKGLGVSPQTLYRRLYYQYGLTVRELREKASETHSAALQAAKNGDSEQPKSPDVDGQDASSIGKAASPALPAPALEGDGDPSKEDI